MWGWRRRRFLLWFPRGLWILLLLQANGGGSVKVSSDYQAQIDGFESGDLARPGMALTCRTQGENVRLEWYLNGGLVSSGPAEYQTGPLGRLECRATHNQATSLAFVEVVANDTTPNDLKITLSSDLDSHQKGSSMELKCTYEHSSAAQFEWVYNGETITAASDRFQVVNRDQSSTLALESLQLSDEGNYGCLVVSLSEGDEETQLSRYQEMALQVRYGPVFTSTPEDVSVGYGQTVSLACSADGNPPPEITWKLNGTNVSELENVASFAISANEIIISSARFDTVGEFTCSAVNGGGDNAIVARATVKLKSEQPIIDPGLPREMAVLEGDEMDLRCEISSGNPEPEVKWVHTSSGDSHWDFQGNVLAIPEAKFDKHNGNWTCVATNVFGSVRRTVKLQVIQRTQIFVNESLVSAHLHTNITLDCQHWVDPHLRGSELISWSKDGQALSSQANQPTLTLLVDSEEVKGSYVCNVSTPHDSLAHTWSVKVSQVPEIQPLPTNVKLFQGGNVSLTCSAHGIPLPSISWFETDTRDSQIATSNTLVLEQVQASKSYSCLAANVHGNSTREVSVFAVTPTAMDMPNNTRHERRAGQDITLNCSSSIDPILLPTTEWVWTKNGQAHNYFANDNSHSLVIGYLRTEHTGDYVCRVKTEVDELAIVQSISVLAKVPEILTKVKSIGVLVGSQIQLECNSTGIPQPEVTWKNSTSAVVSTSSLTVPVPTLLIRNITGTQEGIFTCLAVNEYGRDQHNVSIQVFQPIEVIKGPHDVLADSLERVAFQCLVKIDERLQNDTRIRWIKNGIINVTQKSRPIAQGSTLIFDDVLKPDEGTYTCEIANRLETLNLTVRLTVLGEPPLFISTEKKVRSLVDSNATISCQANGLPMPNVSWYKNGKELALNERFQQQILGDLSIYSVRLEDQGSYLCRAENIYGAVETVAQFQVIKKAAQDSRGLTRELTKSVHDNVTLPCDISYDPRIHEETQFIWSRHNDPEPVATGDKYQIMEDKSLLISELTLKDKGIYECTVKTPFESITVKVSLQISGEAPRILSTLDKMTLYDGDDLLLKCLARGVPTPTLDWLFNGQPLGVSVLDFVPTASDEFIEAHVVIAGASKANEGVYQCETSNLYGSGVAKFVKVDVIRRTLVNIATEGSKEITIHAGQKLKIPCHFKNDPLNRITNIQWSKNGQPIEITAQDRIDFGMDGSITITDVQKRHNGLYVCNVTTVLDTGTDHVTLDVLVNAPVITSHSEDQLIFTTDSIALMCNANGIPEPDIAWKFNKTMTVTEGKEFRIEQAIAADTGKYVCIARNAYGETRQSIALKVVAIPDFELEHTVREGTNLLIPCVHPSEQVSVAWRHNGILMQATPDESGSEDSGITDKGLELRQVAEEQTGVYSCHIETVQGHKRVLQTIVKLKPNILLSEGGQVVLKEGEDMTLQCNTISGLNAKVLWKYEDQFFIQGGSRDIRNRGSLLTVTQVEPSDSGTYSCVAIAPFGQDTIHYHVRIAPTPQKVSASCDQTLVAKVENVIMASNSSVKVKWVMPAVNRSCFEHLRLTWWTNESLSQFHEIILPVSANEAMIQKLFPNVGYYVQVNLVAPFNMYYYGETRSFLLEPVSSPLEEFGIEEQSVPIFILAVVVGILFVLFILLVCLYLKRHAISRCLNAKALRASSKSNLNGGSVFEIGPPISHRISLQVDPDDFMQNLAPQWPEPEPSGYEDNPDELNEDTTETDSFIKSQIHRNSRNSISSSWSSLFNVPNSGSDSVRSSTVSSGGGAARVANTSYRPNGPRVTFALSGRNFRRDK